MVPSTLYSNGSPKLALCLSPYCPAPSLNPPARPGQSPSNPMPYTLALTSHGMDMPLHHGHLTNQQQNGKTPRPGAAPCSLDVPQLELLAPGPSPCPHSTESCRPPFCRTACVRALCTATPARPARVRPGPDHQHTPTPPHYPVGTAPVPPSPCTSQTKHASPCRPLPRATPHL